MARLGRLDVGLLHPVQPRSLEAQRDLSVIRSRSVLVRARSMLVAHVRSTVKLFGERLPSCDTRYFPRKVLEFIPRDLGSLLKPVLKQIAALETDRPLRQIGGELLPKEVPGDEEATPSWRCRTASRARLRSHSGRPQALPAKPGRRCLRRTGSEGEKFRAMPPPDANYQSRQPIPQTAPGHVSSLHLELTQ